MAAIMNRILLRSLSEEVFDFTGASVVSVEAAENVDIIAGKLAIDTADFTVEYEQGEGEDIRTLPYGTPVWHFVGENLIRKCYIKSIDRLTRTRYTIHAMSAIGLLDKQYHKGGLYSGEEFEDVLEDLIGDAVPYTVDEDVAETKIFGYLPYTTKRDNLHQLLFAENISIIRNTDGDMRFTFLRIPETVPAISENRIFLGASVNYPAVATSVELIEHSFQYDDTAERITLIDNVGKSPARRKLYVFDTAPIYVNSLESDGLTIHESGVNYAIVSGNGVLTGVPYYDRMASMIKEYNSGGEEHQVSVSDITVVTGINSENVSERLLSYYTSRETVNADLKITSEKCGGVYTFTDAFANIIQAYLTKITSRVTGILKGACEFVSGYEPTTFGNNYKEQAEALDPCDIVVPEGTSILKLIIIGGGDGGDGGYGPDNITDNAEFIVDGAPVATPGKGGEPGKPGAPGKIKEIVIHDPEAGSYSVTIGMGGKGGAASGTKNVYHQGESGTESTVTTPGGTVYSSGDSDAYTSEKGIMNLFTNHVYAKKGIDGVKGGDGGYGSTGPGNDGEDITYKGKKFKGGKGAGAVSKKFNNMDVTTAFGGAGGEGASAVADGGDATQATLDYHTDQTTQRNAAVYEFIQMNFSHPNKADTFYPEQEADRGCGGDAGCGAPGRGGWSLNGAYLDNYYNANNKLVYAVAGGANDYSFTAGQSSMPGEKGGRGIVIAYADKPLTIANVKRRAAPGLSFSEDPDIPNMMVFTLSNVVMGEKYILQWQKLTDSNSSEWEGHEVTITFTPYQEGYQRTFFEEGVNYVARAKAVGSEEWGESVWTYLSFSLSANKLQKKEIRVKPFVTLENKVVPFIAWGNMSGSAQITVHIERRQDDEIQWYKALSTPAWNHAKTDVNKEFTTGEKLWYRALYTYPGWTASNYTYIVGIEIPALPDHILPPFLVEGTYVPQYGADPDQDAISICFGRMDMRSTIIQIERKDSTEDEWQLLARYNIGTELGKSEGLEMQILVVADPGTTVQIRAKNVSSEYGDSDYSDEIISINIPSNKLRKPDTFEATVDLESGITLNWSSVENASGFKLKRKLSTETTWTTIQASLAANVTSYTDQNVTEGLTYNYRLIALGDGTNYINADQVECTVVYE